MFDVITNEKGNTTRFYTKHKMNIKIIKKMDINKILYIYIYYEKSSYL